MSIIKKLNEEIEKTVSNIDPFRQEIMQLVPELIECDIEFKGELTGEVWQYTGSWDGDMISYNVTEMGTGFIIVDNKEGKWLVHMNWDSDSLEYDEKQKEISNVEELYDYIEYVTQPFEEFEFTEICK